MAHHSSCSHESAIVFSTNSGVRSCKMACLISDGFAASAWFSNSGLSHVQRYSSSLSGAAGLATTGFSSISG